MRYDQFLEVVKIFVPIITFLLGLFAVRFIENMKEDRKAKLVLRNFKLDIQDELVSLKKSISKMVESLQNLNELKKGKRDNLKKILKYVPRETSCYFLKNLFENSFQLLSIRQRFISKSIKVQIEAINANSNNIKNVPLEQNNLEDIIIESKKYIVTSCCLCYCFQEFLVSDNLNDTELPDDQDVITKQLQDLNLDITINDIMVTRLYYFK